MWNSVSSHTDCWNLLGQLQVPLQGIVVPLYAVSLTVMGSSGDLLSAVGSTRQHHSGLSAGNIGFLNVTSGTVLPCLSYWI